MEVVREGGVRPLLSLAHSPDPKVQRNAAGALLNLTHIGKTFKWCCIRINKRLHHSLSTFRVLKICLYLLADVDVCWWSKFIAPFHFM